VRITLLILIAACLQAEAVDSFPVNRRTGLGSGATTNTWASVGIPGGRPIVSTVFTTLDNTISASTLNSIIQSCPSNQVIQLTNKLFNFAGTTINLTKNGVVLRGATNSSGFPTTQFTNTQVRTTTYWGPEGANGNFPDVTVRGVSSGYTEGSTSITLSSAPNSDFAVGSIFVLDQTDDSSLVYPDTHNPALYVRAGRCYALPLYCTNISGSVLSFTPPLLGTYWASGRTPQVFGWASTYGATATRVGFENVDLYQGSGGDVNETVKFLATYQSWIFNVRVRLEGYAATALMWSCNSELRHCIIRDTVGDGSANYATLGAVINSCRIEDNIYSNLSLAITMSSIVGSSVSFNYVSGPYPYSTSFWLAECIFPHGGHPHHDIFEGNWSAGPLSIENLFGNNNSDIGVVRNRFIGAFTGKTANTTPIQLYAHTDNTTILGNSLGLAGYHDTYSGTEEGAARIYGFNATASGTITTNNYNTVDAGVHSPGEVEAAGNSIATSYAYDSKPAWFGDRPWYAFGPSSYGVNAFTNIPAGYRSFYGMDVPAESQPPAGGTLIVLGRIAGTRL